MTQTHTRRAVLKRLAGTSALAAGIHRVASAQNKTLRIAMTLDLSGPEKATGLEMLNGSTAYFNALNRRGGVNGAKIELLSSDDKFDVELAKRNAMESHADTNVLALLHPIGTRQTSALMDAIHDLAIVGPFTGSAALRMKPSPNTFWVRASYDRETEKLVETAASIGMSSRPLKNPSPPPVWAATI